MSELDDLNGAGLGEGAGQGQGEGQDPNNNSDPGKKEDPKDNKQTFESNWRDYIPEDLKNRAEWNNIKNPEDLFKNYINAQQTISKSVRLPEETSSPEDISNFYRKLGKPQDKTEYTFEYQGKDGYIYNKDSFDFTVFQEIADKSNLTKAQYQDMAKAYIDIMNENYINYNQHLQQTASEELKAAEHKLRTSWGDKYNSNINAISEKVKKLYPENTLERMRNAGLFRDPEFLEAHLKLTKMLTGDTVFIEGNAVENVPQTLQALEQKRDKLMAEDYAKNRDQVQALNKQIVQLKQAKQAGAMKYHG